jgi:hypothetical protein
MTSNIVHDSEDVSLYQENPPTSFDEVREHHITNQEATTKGWCGCKLNKYLGYIVFCLLIVAIAANVFIEK